MLFHNNVPQGVRPERHLDFPGVVRRLPRGDVLHLADGQALVAGMGRAPLGVPPEVRHHPPLHRPHRRARNVH